MFAANSASDIKFNSAPVKTAASSPGSMIPRRPAIASAVSLWSPVIIIGRIPADLATFTAPAASGRSGSIIPIKPAKIKSFSSSSETS